VITVFTPAPPASVTVDKDITTRTVTFTNVGSYTFKAQDHSGNTGTVTVN
jgi:plastocyanin